MGGRPVVAWWLCCAGLWACAPEAAEPVDMGVDQWSDEGAGGVEDMGSPELLDLAAGQDMSVDPVDMGLDQESTPPDLTLDAGEEEAEVIPEAGGGCGQPRPAQDQRWTVRHGGLERRFYVHFPPGYDPARPAAVVLNFHGRAMNAGLQALLSGMNEVADRNNFIAVHPEGTGALEQTWNGGVCCGAASTGQVDDVGFVRALLEELGRAVCVDTRRVYATGISNGGFFAHRLGCELADQIAAIAPVAGTLGVFTCAPARPMPVLHFHGDADMIVPYEGFAGFVSVPQTMQGWVERNGCSPQPEVYFDEAEVKCQAWRGCRGGAEVRLCTVEGGGHTWPGGFPVSFLGPTTDTISASEEIWRFFAGHALP